MADYGGAWAVIGCRIAQGLCQGFFFPSMHTHLAMWLPPNERGRLATFVYAGKSNFSKWKHGKRIPEVIL